MVEIDETQLLTLLRDAVRDLALPGYGRLSQTQISSKSSPEDLVTEMDVAVEERLTAALTDLLPGALIIGEEAVAADPSRLAGIAGAELSVILDPIDGTWNYAHALPLWGSILAVCRFGQPVFGAIYDPMSDHLLFAGQDGLKAWKDGQPDRNPDYGPVRGTGFLPSQLMPKDIRERVAAAAARTGLFTSLRCSAHEYRSIAQGLAGWQITGPKPMPWDHAAGVHLIRTAGGVARMLNGQEYDAAQTDGYMLAARDEATWDRVAAALGPILQ